jgi:hypothetical protein
MLLDNKDNEKQGVPVPSPNMRQSNTVKEIMGKCVAQSSNAIFTMYCFENNKFHDTLLEIWFIENVPVLR